MAARRTFSSVLGGNAKRVYVALPFDPDAVWGSKPVHHVAGTINGMRFRGAVETAGGEFHLRIGPAWRKGCGLGAGDAVEVELSPEGPQRDGLDADVAAALEAEPAAAAFFDGLAQFYRKAYLRWISATTQRPDVRAARIAEMVELLKTGRKQRGE
jgi:hypothetical protein